ncbi:uncharacterized protein LOC133196726 [Saccostrea echinata]|uniref:uncharacterized protein LOC133196726 n=1 Tax=Saccostrea echinata TaxID=191078 RepID=UPI002A81346B|nr:uncharacterized protein LOC133196726 [Saccostrea echinata]
MKPKQTELPELSINKGEVVLWDDCFGIWNICDLEEKMKVGVRNTILDLIDRCKNKENYAIICIDSFFDESGMFDQLGKTVISLTENYDSFYEREKVCRSFDKKIYVKEVSKEVGFPLLIALILEHHCPIEKAEDFMKNPIEYLRSNFNNLYKNGKNLYVTLVYVLCNSPSVNLKEIRWRKWKKLREEFQKSKDGENNISQQRKSNQDCQGEEDDLLSDDSMIISSNPKGIEMNTTLAKYLVKTEDPNVYAFRHHFLAHLFLCHHVEKVGNQGILEVGNDEIRSIVKKLQPPLFNSTPVQSGKV